jgi:hypothetical protein
MFYLSDLRERHNVSLGANSEVADFYSITSSAGEPRRRNHQAEPLCDRQVDDKIELGWLHDRQVAGFFPFRMRLV